MSQFLRLTRRTTRAIVAVLAVFALCTLLVACDSYAEATEEVSTIRTTAVLPSEVQIGELPVQPGCLDFQQPLGSSDFNAEIPHDAYDSLNCPNLKPPPDRATQITLQRIYDIYSWRSFVATNWPIELDCSGQGCKTATEPALTGACAIPQWSAWKSSYEIFKTDGSAPAAWDAPRTLPTAPGLRASELPADALQKKTRILYVTEQANSGQPLWDQNGNRVYYEILVNKMEFDYIDKNQLYHLQGQIDYFKNNVLPLPSVAQFPPGSIGSDDPVGAIELKLAWKILTENDIPERYCAMDAYVFDHDHNRWDKATVGLVGMHIAHKTLSSGQWIWTTFAHVDNVQVNDMEALRYLKAGQTLEPSFADPYADHLTLPVNVLPEPDADGVRRTQVLQVLPIPPATEELNDVVQEMLRSQGSVLQYYELIGTQYSTDPNSLPVGPSGPMPDSVTNRSGGKPSPVYLVNPVIETYDQEGNQEASNLAQGPLNDAKELMFGTQSCMGCHFSAGIAYRYVEEGSDKEPISEDGSGDFSFLLSEAHWQER